MADGDSDLSDMADMFHADIIFKHDNSRTGPAVSGVHAVTGTGSRTAEDCTGIRIFICTPAVSGRFADAVILCRCDIPCIAVFIWELFIFPVCIEISKENQEDITHSECTESLAVSGGRNEFLECDWLSGDILFRIVFSFISSDAHFFLMIVREQ